MRRALLAVITGGLLCPWLMARPSTQEPVPAAEGRNPPARAEYELRMLRLGTTYQGLRFKPATGETWQIVIDKWEKLPESGPLPAGDYDVALLPARDTFVAVRLDRAMGTTWMLRPRKWVAFQEPGGERPGQGQPAGKARSRYELRHVVAGDRLHLLRFDTRTGTCAKVEGDTYQVLAESGPVPAGDYDVTVLATEQTWVAFRLERSTGVTWLLHNNRWQKVGEPDAR